MAGLNVASSVAGKSSYLLGEVVPAAYPLITVMVDARMAFIFAILNDVENGLGKVESISRGATLVYDYLHLWFLSGKAKHGLDEVLAKL